MQKQRRESYEKYNENNLNEILEKVNDEINLYKKNKDEFQNNVFNIIEDTCLKLAENKL